MLIKFDKIKEVSFVENSVEEAFKKLKKGKFEDKQLYDFLKKSILKLKRNQMVGIKIPSKFWPKEYIVNYKVRNLWKLGLPNGWRLIYTITPENEVELISAILEWLDHKDYERTFHY